MTRISELVNKHNQVVPVEEAIQFAAKTEGRYMKYVEMLSGKLNLGAFLGLVNISKGYKLPRYVGFTYEKGVIVAKWTKKNSGHLDQFIRVKLYKRPKPGDFSMTEEGVVSLNGTESENISKLNTAKQIVVSLDRELKLATPEEVEKDTKEIEEPTKLSSGKTKVIDRIEKVSFGTKFHLSKNVELSSVSAYVNKIMKEKTGSAVSAAPNFILVENPNLVELAKKVIESYDPKAVVKAPEVKKAAKPSSSARSSDKFGFVKGSGKVPQLKVGTPITVRMPGGTRSGTITEEWNIEFSDNKNDFTVSYENKDGGWWAYVSDIVSINYKPASSYPELNKLR